MEMKKMNHVLLNEAVVIWKRKSIYGEYKCNDKYELFEMQWNSAPSSHLSSKKRKNVVKMNCTIQKKWVKWVLIDPITRKVLDDGGADCRRLRSR